MEEEKEEANRDENIIGTVIPGEKDGILPRIIENLINQRKSAKKRMDESSGIEK